MRYIGGKSLLVERIEAVIDENTESAHSLFDIFAGSTVVSEYFKNRGYQICTNDFLYFSYVIARGTIAVNSVPEFKKLGISDPIGYLNGLDISNTDIKPDICFIYQNYSPNENCCRMYFQNKNALKIDVIRQTVEGWMMRGLISEDEYFYLLAALLNAVPYVANITGVYAAYLKFWDDRTYNDLRLEQPKIIKNEAENKSYNCDYRELLSKEFDILYADPPYNSREYLPNYHILETIARYDYPDIHGVTGMRNYDSQKSVFCRKTTVEAAFETLIRDCRSRYIIISYNNEGLIGTERLTEICKDYAAGDSFRLYEYSYRRYKNKIPNNADGLKEQLYFLRRF